MDDPLAGYLHDHWAGSSFAVELLERPATEFAATPSGNVARELLESIQSDREVLVGKASTDLYDALGWMAERVSRFKLKHDDPSGIGTLEAFETIGLGILGKRGLWEAPEVRQTADTRLGGFDYRFLMGRAEEQFRKANQYRLKLVQSAPSKPENGS